MNKVVTFHNEIDWTTNPIIVPWTLEKSAAAIRSPLACSSNKPQILTLWAQNERQTYDIINHRGGTTFSGNGCPIPRGAATEDEEPRQSASRRLCVEDMDACDIEQARRRGDGVLEGVGSVGGEAEVGLSATSAESMVAAARQRIRSNRERGPDSISRWKG